MSLRKDMTINERVFHQNINNRPSYVIHHLIYYPFYYYLPTCGIQITYGNFREFTNVKEAFTASSGIRASLARSRPLAIFLALAITQISWNFWVSQKNRTLSLKN